MTHSVDPNCTLRPGTMTLLGKAILRADREVALFLLRDKRCDLYHQERSIPTPIACLVTSPDKQLRDAVLQTKAGMQLRHCDRQAVARQTVPLTAAQMAVLNAARRKGKSLSAPKRLELFWAIRNVESDYGGGVAEKVRDYVRTRAPLIINFPLDIIDSLYCDPFLRNQFETGSSKGLLEPILGGARDGWEARMFDGGYHAGPSYRLNAAERPRYGSVCIDKSKRGVIQYGGGVFELADHVRSRVTIAHDDSSGIKSFHLGTLAYADHVLCLIGKDRLRHCIAAALGRHTSPPADGAARLERPEFSTSYVEMQVHGRISLREDIKKIRMRRSSVRPLSAAERYLPERELERRGHISDAQAQSLIALGERYNIKVAWHGTYSSRSDEASRKKTLQLMHTYNWPLSSWHRDDDVDQFMFIPAHELRCSDKVSSKIYYYFFRENSDLEGLSRAGADGTS